MRPAFPILLPSLKGRGWGWVGQLEPQPFHDPEADPSPTPPFQGGEKRRARETTYSPLIDALDRRSAAK